MIPDQADISTLSKLYHSGAWVPLGMLVVFFGLRAAATRVAWLKEDHRAVWVSAILGGAATLIVPLTQGETPNLSMIIAALGTMLALHADPKKTPAEQKQAQAGFARLGLMIALAAIGAALLFGCGGASGRQKTLASTLAGINGAELSLVAFDQSWQDKIIADCRDDSTCTEAIGAARLADAQAKLDTVSKAITAAYKLIGQAFVLDDDPSAANAVAAAAVIVVQLHALGIK